MLLAVGAGAFLRAYLKIDLRIFGDKRGGNDFSSTQVGIALGRLLLGGAIHLAVCAFVYALRGLLFVAIGSLSRVNGANERGPSRHRVQGKALRGQR